MTDTGNWLREAQDRCEAAIAGLEFVEWGFYCPWCGKLSDSNEHLPDCGRDVLLVIARTDLPLALDLLAQALEMMNSLGKYCPWCGRILPEHGNRCRLDAFLARIRKGDSGE